MHPTLTQVPPTVACSIMTTETCLRRASMAVANAALPEPTTARPKCVVSDMLVLLCEVAPRLSAEFCEAGEVGCFAQGIARRSSPLVQVLLGAKEVGERTQVGSDVLAVGRWYPAPKRRVQRRLTVVDVHRELSAAVRTARGHVRIEGQRSGDADCIDGAPGVQLLPVKGESVLGRLQGEPGDADHAVIGISFDKTGIVEPAECSTHCLLVTSGAL